MNKEPYVPFEWRNRLRKELSASRSPLYRLYYNAKARCCNPNFPSYKDYGGRGITFYEGWMDDREAFISYIRENLGDKPTPQHSLDRVDNDKGYIPGNLRWATRKEQIDNRRLNK